MNERPAVNENPPPVEPEFTLFPFPVDLVGLVVGPALFVAWLLLVDLGLPRGAHIMAGIMMLTIFWWLTEPIPIAATGLLAVALSVTMDVLNEPGQPKTVDTTRVALAPFGEPALFFLLGGMFLGRAMSRQGLDRRFALSILTTSWAGRSPTTVLLALGVAVTLISMWISNTAATAMVYPVTMGIITVVGAAAAQRGQAGFAKSAFATTLLLMTAYGSSVGGIATPIGTSTNVVAKGLFDDLEYFGRQIDFLRWMQVGVPMMLVLFLGMFVWLRLFSRPGELDMPALRDYLQTERAKLGPWRRGEVNAAIAFLIVVLMWTMSAILDALGLPRAGVWFQQHFPEEIVAIMIPVLLCLLPVSLKDRQFTLMPDDFLKVDWTTMLLFGSGLSLGAMMFKTGLAKAVGEASFHALPSTEIWVVTMLTVAAGIFLSDLTSNTATATTLIPVSWAICASAGIDPLYPLVGLTFGASFGSALPVSTPPNAIVYGSGIIPIRRMIFAGVGLDLICWAAICATLAVASKLGWSPWTPLTGLN